ncbi:pre-60S ribosomal particles component [Mortierella sp. AM989]|nr:pre-60S ribosomal particles component [Mortierella sp. AM989]
MKRSSSSALPAPKFRKQAPVDDYKSSSKNASSKPGSAKAATSEPKSILKRPLRPESTGNKSSQSSPSSKPKGSISGASILKANTSANKSSSKSASFAAAGSKGGKPKVVAVRASRGDVTGGIGRKKRKASTEEVNSGDDSDSDNDGDNDEDSEDEEEDDEDDLEGISATTTTGKKSSKKHSEESMAEAMSKILGSTLRKADAGMPILARSRGAERKLEEEKMEAKARKAITNERRRLANKDRVKPEYTGMEYEKKLRKVATRGVVQLFNAIKAQQKVTEDLTEKERPITTNAKDKVANLTKASFLDLLKSGTKVPTV